MASKTVLQWIAQIPIESPIPFAMMQLLESRLLAADGDSAAARLAADATHRGLVVAVGEAHAETRRAETWAHSLAIVAVAAAMGNPEPRQPAP